MKKTVLIFGISSFVGSNLAFFLRDDFRVVGTFHRNPVTFPGITTIPCDVLKKDMVTNVIRIFKPDVVIYAVGMSSLTECKLNPKLAEALNSSGAINCCMASELRDALFIYLSSVFVFDGQDEISREGDTPLPITTYGHIVSTTEFYIQRSSLYYLILRCSPLLGRSYTVGRENWFETLQKKFAKNEPVPVDDTVTCGFLDVSILAKVLKVVIDGEVSNRLLHVSSSDWMTRFAFATLFAGQYRKDSSLIQRVSGAFPVEASRVKTEVSSNFYYKVDTANLEMLVGVPMPTIQDSLTIMQKRLRT